MTLEEFKEYKNRPKCFYTKEEIQEILNDISQKVVVDTLPTEGLENYLYLVPSIVNPGTYEQYTWKNNTWEHLGNVDEALYTDYVTNPELDNTIERVSLVTSAALNDLDNRKQDALVSGQNIKSINGQSVLGSGNMTIHEAQLIDKSYAPAEFSGLGRKYLQKNIVSDKNVLTQAMMNDANTIYVIQYDYDLNGASITVPSGCVLQFEGGSLSNGTIVGNGTNIKAKAVKIFGDDINIVYGEWTVNEAYPEWFEDVQKAIDNFPTIRFSNKKYVIDKSLELHCCSQIVGERGSSLTFKNLNNSVAIKIGACSNIYNIKILTDNVVDSDIISIDADYITQTKVENRFRSRGIEASSCIYYIEDVSLYHALGHIENISNTAIKLTANNGNGFYGNICRNVQIIGYWDYGIHIDTGGGESDGWLTNLTFKDVMCSICRYGVVIDDSVSGSNTKNPAEGIFFGNYTYQTHSDRTINPRAIVLNAGNNITFKNLQIWDWHFTGAVTDEVRPVLINPNKCSNLNIEGLNAYNNERLYAYSETYSYQSNPKGVHLRIGDNYNTAFSIMSSLDTDDITPLNVALLADGLYYAGPLYRTYFKLENILPDKAFIIDKKSIMNFTLLRVYSYNGRSGSANQTNLMAYMLYDYDFEDSFRTYYWVGLQVQIKNASQATGTLFKNTDGTLGFNNGSYVQRADGFKAESWRGTTSDRPSASTRGLGRGYRYFDFDLNKFVYIGSQNSVAKWFEDDGAIAGTSRNGTFANKPASTDIYVGFQYFNTDTHKMITWDGSKWYNPDGTEATA